MIEFLGLFYGVAKDIKEFLSWDEEAKIVDRVWLDKSGFGELMKKQGYKLYWSKQEKVESRKLEGYEILYEIDKKKHIRRYIERKSDGDSLILIGKKDNI